MIKKVDIIIKHKIIHGRLGREYYKLHLLSLEDFQVLHAANWEDMQRSLIENGHLQAPLPEFDPVGKTREQKVDELLRREGLQ